MILFPHVPGNSSALLHRVVHARRGGTFFSGIIGRGGFAAWDEWISGHGGDLWIEEGGGRGCGLCLFFTVSGACAQHSSVPCDRSHKHFAVIRAFFRNDGVARASEGKGLEGFLKLPLGINLPGFIGQFLQGISEQREHDPPRDFDSGIEVQGAHDSLHGIREGTVPLSASGRFFAAPHLHEIAQSQIPREGCEGTARNHPRPQFCQASFMESWKGAEQKIRQEELEHRVSEELEPLIARVGPMQFVRDTWMCQRLFKEPSNGKRMAERFFQRMHAE